MQLNVRIWFCDSIMLKSFHGYFWIFSPDMPTICCTWTMGSKFRLQDGSVIIAIWRTTCGWIWRMEKFYADESSSTALVEIITPLTIIRKQTIRWPSNWERLLLQEEVQLVSNTVAFCSGDDYLTPVFAVDVYSYDEDDMVLDPLLSEHLAHFGINVQQMEKVCKVLINVA